MTRSRADQIFPVLTPSQIGRMAAMGRKRSVRSGEVLIFAPSAGGGDRTQPRKRPLSGAGRRGVERDSDVRFHSSPCRIADARRRRRQSQRGTRDAFLHFSKLLLVDIAAAWQRADVEQRVRIQNFLFQDRIAYEKNHRFLNTAEVTLFQQLRGLARCKDGVGVPDGI